MAVGGGRATDYNWTPMLRLVLDTNVVLDLFHFADPAARPILAALRGAKASCFADDATLDELARVVAYPEFGLSPEAGRALVDTYGALAIPAGPALPPPAGLPRCRDRDDQKFLCLAARVEADLLISKDKALLKLKGRQGLAFRIATPAAAAALLGPGAG